MKRLLVDKSVASRISSFLYFIHVTWSPPHTFLLFSRDPHSASILIIVCRPMPPRAGHTICSRLSSFLFTPYCDFACFALPPQTVQNHHPCRIYIIDFLIVTTTYQYLDRPMACRPSRAKQTQGSTVKCGWLLLALRRLMCFSILFPSIWMCDRVAKDVDLHLKWWSLAAWSWRSRVGARAREKER